MRVPDDVTLLWADDKYVPNYRNPSISLIKIIAGVTSVVSRLRTNVTAQVVLECTTMSTSYVTSPCHLTSHILILACRTALLVTTSGSQYVSF